MKNLQKGFVIPIIIAIVILVVIGGGAYFYVYNNKVEAPTNTQEPVACAMDAMECPDGSWVGRTGPNCEFAECPAVQGQTANWKTYINTQYGFEIKYPNNWFMRNISQELPGIELSPISFQELDKYNLATTGKDISSVEFSESFARFKNVIKINVKNDLPPKTCESNPPQIQKVKIGDIIGCREEGYTNWTIVNLSLPLPDKNLSLLINTTNENEYLDVFDKVVSTFKFTK